MTPSAHAAVRHRRRTLIVVGVVALAVSVALLIALEIALLPVTNRLLDKNPTYSIVVQDVDLEFWRGTFKLDGLVVRERAKGPSSAALAEVKSIRISLDLHALMHGAVVSSFAVDTPSIRFVATPQRGVFGPDASVVRSISDLSVLRVNRVEMVRGRVDFASQAELPSGVWRKIDMKMTRVHLIVDNVTNSRNAAGTSFCVVHATGDVEGWGRARLDMKVNPTSKEPTFEMQASIVDLPLVALNDWTLAFGKFAFDGGSLSLFSEVAALDGRYSGYVKPLAHNVHTKERPSDPLSTLVGKVVEGAAKALENKSSGKAGAKIPFEGRFGRPKVDIFAAVGSMLQNATINALRPVVDGDISLSDATP